MTLSILHLVKIALYVYADSKLLIAKAHIWQLRVDIPEKSAVPSLVAPRICTGVFHPFTWSWPDFYCESLD